MNAWRTCGFALLVVIVAPLVLGFMWPSGTVTEDVWEVEQGIDITNSLNNREIDVWDYYRGPLNNLSVYKPLMDGLYFPTADTTTVPNNYPIAAVESTTTVQDVDLSTLAMSGKARYTVFGDFTVTGDPTTYYFGDYWPNTNTLIVYQMNPGLLPDTVKTLSPKAGDEITGTDLTLKTFGAPTGYIDLKKGLSGVQSVSGWTNELRNRTVEMWVTFDESEYSNSISIEGLTLTRAADGLVSATYGGTTEALGSAYRFISVVFDLEKIQVRGLMGPEDFGATTYTVGNAVSFDSPRTGEIRSLTLSGQGYHWWIKQTMTAISTTRGISDSAVVPDSYYPTHAWQMQIVDIATFGKSLTIAGINYPVTDGSITVTNADTGESSMVPVRGLRILSLVLDGQQEISVSGVTVLKQTPRSVTVSMDGQWYASVVLSKVNQSEVTNYVYTPGSFNFSKSAYCIVGILACAGVAVGGSLWNKNKDSTIPLYIAMGCAGACYLIMMG